MSSQTIEIAKAVLSLLEHLLWPSIVFLVVIKYAHPIEAILRRFGDGDVSLKAGGIEVSMKRLEVATLLGAARPADGVRPSVVADFVTKAVTSKSIHSLRESRVLWVDDMPSNNAYERRALEALGIKFTTSTSTEDALPIACHDTFDVIVSDMGRGDDPQAGHTLLQALRREGIRTPVVFYTRSATSEEREQALRLGAVGQTSSPQELFDMVVRTITQ